MTVDSNKSNTNGNGPIASPDNIDCICEHALQRQWASADTGVMLSAESIFELYPALTQHPERQVDIVYNEFLIACENDPRAAESTQSYIERFPDLKLPLERQFQLYSGLSSGLDSESTFGSEISDLSQDLVGFVLQQRYELLEKIGAGGIADVYRALDRQLDREVAIKISRASFARESLPFRRFLREAESAAKLSHPGIVQVFEFSDFEGRPYIVAQLIGHGTLANLARHETASKLNVERLCGWMTQICEAVEYAHLCKIVHRDLKPANILFDSHSRPMITDFGLAALLEGDAKLTGHGDIVGTPAYMSPEQAQASEVGPLSDVYSLGVILYEQLTGSLPLTGTSASILHRLQQEEPALHPPISRTIPSDLQTICVKAMARSKEDRYQSARAMADDLRRFQKGEPILARRLTLPEKVTRVFRRYPTASLLASALLIVLGFSLAGYLQYRNVVDQRDRANAAERRTRQLAARDATASGKLAQKKGLARSAVRHYQEAIELGSEHPGDLLYFMAECHLILCDSSAAEEALQAALDEGVHTIGDSTIDLFEARLSLLQQESHERVIALLDAVDVNNLSDPDKRYLQGLNAHSSRDALMHFLSATELDSHHLASRTMAIVLALSLAEFETAGSVATVSRQLFPDDLNFILLEALSLAGRGSVQKARNILSKATDLQDRDTWLEFINFVASLRTEYRTGGERVFHKHLEAKDSELSFQSLLSLFREFEAKYAPLLIDRNWHLPPHVALAFERFSDAASSIEGDGETPESNSKISSGPEMAQAGLEMIGAHPEGTLSTVIARHLIDMGVATPVERQQLQNIFQSAFASKAFATDVREHALLGDFAATSHLLLLDGVEPEQNLQRMRRLLKMIEPENVYEIGTARVMTLLPIRYSDWDLAARFAPRWVTLAREQPENKMLVSALWHVAVIQEHNAQWKRVAETCEEIMRISPEPELRDALIEPELLRERAAAEMTNLMTEENLMHWGTFFRSAIHEKNVSMAEFGLKQIESETDIGQDELQELAAELKKLKDFINQRNR